MTVSELEDLLRKKKNNTTKPPVNKVAEPLSPEKKDGSYSLKAPPNKRPQSKVSSDGRTFDWGSVMQGEVVTHDFEIRNPGLTPLIIEDVKPACGCTKGAWTRTIAPGGTGKVSLSVKTIRFSGKIRKTAEVITKVQGKITLAMKGEVEVAIIQEPPPANRGFVKVSGVPLEKMKIALRKGTERTFKINTVSCPNRIAGRESPPLVSLELLEFEDGSHYELVVTPQLPLVLDADNPAQLYTANIVANVTVEGKTFDLPLNVAITIKERIDVSPSSVLFGNKDIEELDKPGAAPATREVLIKSLHPAHSFNIAEVRIQGEHIKTHLETVTPGKEYKLAIELAKKPNATETRKIIETIFVDTDDDDPNLQELKIKAVLLYKPTQKNKSPISSDFNGSKKPTKSIKSQPTKPKVVGPPAPNATGGSS